MKNFLPSFRIRFVQFVQFLLNYGNKNANKQEKSNNLVYLNLDKELEENNLMYMVSYIASRFKNIVEKNRRKGSGLIIRGTL